MSRLVDRGAIFAGWVGVGMAAVIVLSFELVIPLQTVVFLSAPLAGLLIGYYANARSYAPPVSDESDEADRDSEAAPGLPAASPANTGAMPARWPRLLANALYAGIVTGIALAILYGAVRLLFFYADQGYRPDSQGGAVTCQAGADCVYQRYLADPASAAELRAAGVTNAAGFERYFLGQQFDGEVILIAWTVVPALVGGAMYAASRPRQPVPTPVPEPRGE